MKRREDYERQPPRGMQPANEDKVAGEIQGIRVALAKRQDDEMPVIGLEIKLEGRRDTLFAPFDKAGADGLIAQLIHARNTIWPTP